MNRTIRVVLMLLALTISGGKAETVRELVDQAVQAPGRYKQDEEESRAQVAGVSLGERIKMRERQVQETYVVMRDRVVALGKEVLPELRELRDNAQTAWPQRALAGICIERIEHGAEIQSFTDRQRWKNDPEMQKDPTWQNRGGPYRIRMVAVNRWLEAGLTNHLVQLAWKGDGEVPPFGANWTIEAAKTLENIKHPALVNIARERVQGIQEPQRMEGNWYYSYLMRVKDHQSLPLMLDLWVKYREIEWPRLYGYLAEPRYHNTPEQCANGANELDRFLELLLSIATVADEGWIMEKLKNVNLGGDGRMYVAQYQDRCRQATRPSVVPPKTTPVPKEK